MGASLRPSAGAVRAARRRPFCYCGPPGCTTPALSYSSSIEKVRLRRDRGGLDRRVDGLGPDSCHDEVQEVLPRKAIAKLVGFGLQHLQPLHRLGRLVSAGWCLTGGSISSSIRQVS
eukprot:6483367-Prymnesium_polylepis.2